MNKNETELIFSRFSETLEDDKSGKAMILAAEETGANAPIALAVRRTPAGTFWSWQDAWRDMGRDEMQIADEEARRNARAEAEAGERRQRRNARRWRRRWFVISGGVWGRSAGLTCAMKARLAPVAGYIFEALAREWWKPSWSGGEFDGAEGCARPAMTLRRLFSYAVAASTGGVFVKCLPRATAWRDFGRAIRWTRNLIFGAVARGEMSRAQGDAMRACLDCDVDGPLLGVMGKARKLFTRDFGLGDRDGKKAADCFTDAYARVRFNENKRKTPLYDVSAKNQAQADVDAAAICSKSEAIPKFSGKFPHRLWWIVRKYKEEFMEYHDDPNCLVKWSGKNWTAWFKACLVAGRGARSLVELYDEVLLRWRARAVDWGAAKWGGLEPYGMFAELYRKAAELPVCDFPSKKQKQQNGGVK